MARDQERQNRTGIFAQPQAMLPSSPVQEMRGDLVTPSTDGGNRRPSPGSPFDEGSLVTLRGQTIPVTQALGEVFRQTGKDFKIDSHVHGHVTVDMTNVGFQQALRNVLQASSQSLSCRIEKGVYMVRVDGPPSPPQLPQPPQVTTPTQL